MQVTGATDGWLGIGFSEGSSVSMIGGSGGGSDAFICSESNVKRYWYLGFLGSLGVFPCFFWGGPCFSSMAITWLKNETLRITSYTIPSGGVPWRSFNMTFLAGPSNSSAFCHFQGGSPPRKMKIFQRKTLLYICNFMLR